MPDRFVFLYIKCWRRWRKNSKHIIYGRFNTIRRRLIRLPSSSWGHSVVNLCIYRTCT